MYISPPSFEAPLSKGLRGLYAVMGDEPLLVQEAGDAIRRAARHHGFT